jgi:hypothetical protein
VRDKENKYCWMFVPEQMCALDANASSSNPQKLLDNKIHCPQRKIVSKQQTVLIAPFSTQQVTDLPISQHSPHLKTHLNSPYGPQVAVPSIPSRFPRESCHSHYINGVELCQNDKSSFSVKKNIREQWTVTQTLPSYMKVNISPVSQVLTCPHTCYESSYRPQLAVLPSH